MRALVALQFAVTLLSSCATQAISRHEAQQMSDLTLKEFLTERFGKMTKTQAAFVAMTRGMENLAGFFSKAEAEEAKRQQARRVKVRPDGSFVYIALYDGSQQVQLMRPMSELRAFCDAQGGRFTISRRYDPEEIENLFRARMSAAIAEGAVVDAAVGLDQQTFALQGAGAASRLDRIEDRAGASAGYRAAAHRGAFGEGACDHPTNKRANWKVDVKAI